jgi:hypothetical protein
LTLARAGVGATAESANTWRRWRVEATMRGFAPPADEVNAIALARAPGNQPRKPNAALASRCPLEVSCERLRNRPSRSHRADQARYGVGEDRLKREYASRSLHVPQFRGLQAGRGSRAGTRWGRHFLHPIFVIFGRGPPTRFFSDGTRSRPRDQAFAPPSRPNNLRGGWQAGCGL